MKTDSEKRKILIEVSIDWDGYEDVHDEIIIEDAITTEKAGVSWKIVAPSSPLKPLSELTEEHAVEIWGIVKGNKSYDKLTKTRTQYIIENGAREMIIDLHSGNVFRSYQGVTLSVFNQVQIIKFYMDHGYDIFGENK